ncbi:hypothetical protein BX666DRAFT_1864603 [Dichotomocladium elegans]|nr:hypothetical protein BX666DRAFT_1864603 [Dichotomocladium elegans]
MVFSFWQTKKVVKRRGRPPKPASEKKKKAPVDPAVKKAAAATAKKAGKDQERSKEEKRYCTCHRTFISPLFMIPCNECQNWFHGACMGVTFSEAAFFDLYYCPDCTSGEGAQLGHELNMEQNRRDRKQIEKIKRNASKLKAEAKLVNRKLELLQQILVCQSTAAARGSEMDICGFDSRLTWQDHVTKAIQRIYAVEEGTAVAIDFDADIARNDSMYTICDRPRKCPVHEKWREDKRAELACERRLYLEKIASYDRNLKHLRRRIHQRLQKGDTWEFLENGTIQHNIHTTTD